jgi:hypothetical protein
MIGLLRETRDSVAIGIVYTPRRSAAKGTEPRRCTP